MSEYTDGIPSLETTWIEEIGRGFPPGSLGEGFLDGTHEIGDVVATAGGVNLTQLQVNAALAFAEFLGGAAFADGERSYLTDVIKKDFGTDPASSTLALNHIVRALIQVPRMDPERRAHHRLLAYTTTHLSELAAGLSTPLMESVRRLNPVVLVDHDERVMITADALDAYWSTFDLVAVVAGLHPSSSQDRHRLVDSLPEAYPMWSPHLRFEVIGARERWVGLRRTLQAMTDEQRADFAADVCETVITQVDVATAVVGLGVASAAHRLHQRIGVPAATSPA